MAITPPTDPILGNEGPSALHHPGVELLRGPSRAEPQSPEVKELELPEANYGVEVKAMRAVIAQFRNLIGNLEGLLFSLQVHSHRIPDVVRPEKLVVMEDGDFVQKTPGRLIRGYGICQGKEADVTNVHAPTNEQETTDSGS